MKSKRISLFILENKEGKVLLQHRDKNAPTNPNKWGLFGGSIKKNETAREAAEREAREELGIELKDINFFKKYVFKGDILRHVFVFEAPLEDSIEKVKKQQNEGDEVGLFSQNDLNNIDVVDYALIILKDFFGCR